MLKLLHSNPYLVLNCRKFEAVLEDITQNFYKRELIKYFNFLLADAKHSIPISFIFNLKKSVYET